MKSIAWLGWMGLGLALGVLGSASCGGDLEDFCAGWVEDTCQGLAGCCVSGTTFDLEACRLSVSSTCYQQFRGSDVRSGAAIFDEGAARACGPALTCAMQQQPPAAYTFEHRKACSNAVTGFQPPGSACNQVTECAREGEFSQCYQGLLGSSGICATVVLDEERCGFSFDDSKLHVCPDDKFCDRRALEPVATDTPVTQAYAFSAPCKARIAAGASCIDSTSDSDVLPCQSGLYCDVTGVVEAVCAPVKAAGASCNGSVAEECVAGTYCLPDPMIPGNTCQEPSGGGPYCFAPSTCGDGKCDLGAGENELTCIPDCSGGFCGDGLCDTFESPFDCPQDCGSSEGFCGDGVCSLAEHPSICPEDCGTMGFCGDGVCGADEAPDTCPDDCFGFCGDSICSMGEDAGTCPQDCGV